MDEWHLQNNNHRLQDSTVNMSMQSEVRMRFQERKLAKMRELDELDKVSQQRSPSRISSRRGSKSRSPFAKRRKNELENVDEESYLQDDN